jgi:hypothetical protein
MSWVTRQSWSSFVFCVRVDRDDFCSNHLDAGLVFKSASSTVPITSGHYAGSLNNADQLIGAQWWSGVSLTCRRLSLFWLKTDLVLPHPRRTVGSRSGSLYCWMAMVTDGVSYFVFWLISGRFGYLNDYIIIWLLNIWLWCSLGDYLRGILTNCNAS